MLTVKAKAGALFLAVILAGCGSAYYPQPCITERGRISPITPWFGARLDWVGGKGTGCDAPVRIHGEYQRCSQKQCVSTRVIGTERVPHPILVVQRLWIQVNYFEYKLVDLKTEDCGSYVAQVAYLQIDDEPPLKVYFDVRGFKAVEALCDEQDYDGRRAKVGCYPPASRDR
jgi:hypothetical protein